MNDIRKDVIREIFRKLSIRPSQEELDMLTEQTVVQKFKHKKIVVDQGEVCQYFYYIDKGLIRQYVHSDNQEVTVSLRHEGQFVSCLNSFFHGTPSTVIMKTIEPTTLYGITAKSMYTLSERHPNIMKFFFTLMIDTIETMESAMHLMRIPLASTRYSQFMADDPETVRRTPVKYLASLLLMRQETLSRVRSTCSDDAIWEAYEESQKEKDKKPANTEQQIHKKT